MPFFDNKFIEGAEEKLQSHLLITFDHDDFISLLPRPLELKERKVCMKYFIPQIDQSDCGFACLKMLIARLYEDERALYIKQNEGHGPYSMKELKDTANGYGITLQGIEVDDKGSIKEMNYPFIALLKKKNDLYHYVLVTKCKWGTVYFSDPSEGVSTMSIKSFYSTWTGNALIVENFERQEVEFQGDLTKTGKKNYLTVIFQILSALALGAGIYFIDEKTKIYIPLMFLGFSVVFEIILRIILIKQMEKMDEDFILGLDADRKKLYQLYERYEDYKKKSILSKMNIIFTFLIIIFIAFITIMNNIYNVFLILVPLFIALIDVKFVDGAIKEKDELISVEEREIVAMKNIDVFKRQIDKIHLRGYKVARLMLVKKYIYVAIIAIIALVTTVFNETFSLPYVIFYFAIGYMLFEQYTNFMKYPNTETELLKAKVRLNNLIERI